MARMPRQTYAGALYHVFSRGDKGQYILAEAAYKACFARILIETLGIFKARIHAFCIMDNHYHLLLQTEEDNLPIVMHRLGSLYANYLQKEHDFQGHIFAGRFNSLIVETNEYLLALARYIHLNPVRAGMVKEVREYPWSSHKFLTGELETPTWMKTDWILGQFWPEKNARDRYRIFMEEEADAALLEKEAVAFDKALSSGFRTLERALFEQTALQKLREVVLSYYGLSDFQCAGKKADAPLSRARQAFAYLAKTFTDQTRPTIAQAMGIASVYAILNYQRRLVSALKNEDEEAALWRSELRELRLIWGLAPSGGQAPHER